MWALKWDFKFMSPSLGVYSLLAQLFSRKIHFTSIHLLFTLPEPPEVPMAIRRVASLSFLLLCSCISLAATADADSLQFQFTSSTDQTVIVGSSLMQVTFEGFITNGSQSPITFALITPSPESPFVASVMSPFPFPGITLAAGDSTPLQALATVTFNLFDPSLQYPGVANIVLEAETLQGNIIAESNLTVQVLSSAVPEPSSLALLVLSCFGLLLSGAARRGVYSCFVRRRMGMMR
jgi:hypothetical protein